MIQDKKCDACGRTECCSIASAYSTSSVETMDYEWSRCGWHRIRRTNTWLCPPCVSSIVGDHIQRANELRRQAEAKADQFRRRAHAAEAKLEDQ